MAAPKRIRKIEYDRIDRVEAGAQPGAHVTLVKARKTRLAKLIDPASIDAKVQSVRDAFRDQYGNNYGCCSPCSGYVYVDAVYDEFVIACDSDGEYWRFPYTIGGGDGDNDSDDVTFAAPENVNPTVSWGVEKDDTNDAPTPTAMMKSRWEASVADRAVRITKWTDTPDNRKKLAKMDPPQALSDGSYPVPTTDYVNKAIQALGRAGTKRPMVLALIKRRAAALGMDLSDSSVPELAGKTKTAKEHKMPGTATVEDLDLTGLDDATRLAVEGHLAELETLRTAAPAEAVTPAAPAAGPEDGDEDDEDVALDSIAGIQKAIKKSRSPETKRLLKATLSHMQKMETEAAENRETTARLQKAERVRIFKSRAAAVGHMAPHAGGVDELAGLLETIDDKAGSETCEAVEAILTKAHTQAHELLDKKGLLKSVGRVVGEGEGFAGALSTSGIAADDAKATVEELAATLRKEHPDLSAAQARTRVLKARPELYAQSIAQ